VQLPDEVTSEVRQRLRRVGGQVQGIERMLEEGRDCKEIVTQISAATKALERAGLRMVAAGLIYCLERPEDAQADGYDVDTVQRMFMQLA